MTGGPNTECATCPNYQYEDLVDYYWPALIAGVEKYSGENVIQYVGHSNGCRVALDSLKNWSSTGKNDAGYYFDTTTGQYLLADLASNPVDTFVGLGCPGALNGSSHVISKGLENGDRAIQFFKNNSQLHVSGREFAKRLDLDFASFWPSHTISLNLANFYKNIAKSSDDPQPGLGLNINSFYLIAGEDSISEFGKHNGDDGLVPLEDPIAINSTVSYNGGKLVIYSFPHHKLPDEKIIHNYIKNKLVR